MNLYEWVAGTAVAWCLLFPVGGLFLVSCANEGELVYAPLEAPSVRWDDGAGSYNLHVEPVCLDGASVGHTIAPAEPGNHPEVPALDCVWPCHLYFSRAFPERGISLYYVRIRWKNVPDGTETGQWVMDPSHSGVSPDTECESSTSAQSWPSCDGASVHASGTVHVCPCGRRWVRFADGWSVWQEGEACDADD